MQYSLEIDDHLFEKLKDEADKSGYTLAGYIALLLRRCLGNEGAISRQEPEKQRFVVKPWSLDAHPGVDFTSTSRLLDSLDEERYPG